MNSFLKKISTSIFKNINFGLVFILALTGFFILHILEINAVKARPVSQDELFVNEYDSSVSCEKNLMTLGFACEKYAIRHNGRYPDKISDLFPGCIKNFPICEKAGRCTYALKRTSDKNPKAFSVFCQGSFHTLCGFKPNTPCMDFSKGFTDRNRIEYKNYILCCKEILELAQACSLYASEHQGNYPVRLTELTPKYIKRIAMCPSSSGKDTYISSYRSDKNKSFYIYCEGKYHKAAGIEANYPAYFSSCGFVKNKPQ